MAVGRVASGTRTNPRRQFLSCFALMGCSALVAKPLGDALPLWSVTSPGARDGMSYFVKQSLMVRLVVVPCAQIPRNGDAFLGVVAKTSATLCVIESETP